MKKLTAILAGISAVAFASTAQAQTATISYTGTPVAIPTPQNDFASQLAGLGVTRYVTAGTSFMLSGPAQLSFEFLGSESGYSDTFTAGSANYTENSNIENHFGSPILLGFQNYASGGMISGLNFTTSGVGSGGANAGIGAPGFGLFLGPNQVSGASGITDFYLGYDDQVTNSDDNHDDFIVHVRVGAPVPEPATWAMMLVGFGAVGYGMRRRTRKTALQAA